MSVALYPHVYAEDRAYIVFEYKGMRYEYVDSLISPTDHLVAQEIFDRFINAPLSSKLAVVHSKVRGGADYKSAMLFCFPLLERTIEHIKSEINCSPTDSTIRFDPSKKPMFSISRDRAGVEVIEDRLYMDTYLALSASSTATVKIPVRSLTAAVSVSDNVRLTNLRASFSTDCANSTYERKHNISLALSKLSGTVLSMGETLSFNQKVGRRTSQNGFKEAKIIVGGKYVAGLGGGVCQASTTLYNAALRSDLTIVEVNRHTLASSYVQPSFDAMVNSGSSDLVIRNDGDTPVFICAYCDGQRAHVRIYGVPLNYKIKCESEVTFTGETPGYDREIDYEHKYFDDELPGATKILSYSHPEIHSNGYLLYYDFSGKLIERKLIRSDKYSSVRGVIAVAP